GFDNAAGDSAVLVKRSGAPDIQARPLAHRHHARRIGLGDIDVTGAPRAAGVERGEINANLAGLKANRRGKHGPGASPSVASIGAIDDAQLAPLHAQSLTRLSLFALPEASAAGLRTT